MSSQLTSLTRTAEWCLMTQKGILTPGGKPKKPPTYLIVKCSRCGDLSIQKLPSYNIVDGKRVPARPKPCDLWGAKPSNREVMSLPEREICKGRVEPVSKIGDK